MKTNKKLGHCLMTLFWVMLLTTTAKAQVRVGGETDPQPGAVLDLEMKQGGSITDYYIGGLHLPNIDITDLEKIPGSLGNGAKTSATPYTFLSGQADKDTDLTLAGMIVYNTNTTTGKGVYYWDGYIWKKLNGESSINIVNPAGKDPFDPTIPTNKDPNDVGSPVFPEAGDTKGPFTPHDEPECTTTTPGYKTEIISGNAYAHLDYTGLSSAQKNMGAFLLTFDPNSNVYVRYAVVRVTNNCMLEYKDFLFSQEAASIGVFPNPSEPNIKPEGEDRGPYTPDADLTKCTGNYNVTSNQNWCIVTFNPSTGKFSLRYLPNPGLTQRVATITITKGTCTKSYQVTQDAGSIILSPDPTEIETQASGGETNPATPQGNPTCSGQTVNYSISLVGGFGYAHLVILNVQSRQFKVKFDTNTSIYPRYAVVRVKDNCTGMTRDFTLTQNGQQVGINPDPSQPPVPAPGEDRGPFTPETNPEKCPAPVYSVTTNQSWCKAVITNTATGTFKLLFEPNYLSSSRYVNVTISATNCEISSTYRIEQKGANVDIGIGNYPAPDVPATGGDTKSGVPDSEVRCDQTPAYVPTLISGKEYATLVVDNTALGIFHVNFSANPSTSSRTATVRVTNPCNGLYSDFVYTQLGSDCATKAITTTGPLSQSVKQGKGTAITEVTFTSLSPITVTGSSPGITISGRGSSTVTITGTPTTPGDYTISANTGSAGCANENKTFLLTVTADACATLPTAPTGEGAMRCGAGEVSLSVNGAGTGENYRWYDASGNPLSEGSTYNPTISATTTYYVSKYNTSGCETASANRLAITATVTTSPVVGTITKTSGNNLMKIGETLQLSITTPGGTWASSNQTVATVDNTGKVTAKAEGTTTINYTISGTGCTDAVATYCTIIVSNYCPVKISDTEYITFRCYNLGADETVNWRVPQKGLNGNYYQWGRTAAVATVNTPAGAISGWNSSPVYAKNIYMWTDSQADPCTTSLGAGWRLPTNSEWIAVSADLGHNTYDPVGPFTTDETFVSGMNLIPNGVCESTLFIPMAGYRNTSDGALSERGYRGHYWGSDQCLNNPISDYRASVSFMMLNNAPHENHNGSLLHAGFSVRCIK